VGIHRGRASPGRGAFRKPTLRLLRVLCRHDQEQSVGLGDLHSATSLGRREKRIGDHSENIIALN
jgi:hypothetical protein